ncbi:MAG: class I SAM-dependent methyltransferase [Chryseobacterium sp.]|nr:MAG: class I SAM-dependent methyltransferase [Chryseobacterium sp.]
MDKYEETFETWNKVAEKYQEKFMKLELYDDTYRFICKEIEKRNAQLLDVGCGPGNITKFLLHERPDFEVLGIDIAANMIDLAKINNPNANFAVMDTRQITDLDARFDGIVCGFCLPYLSETDCSKLIADSSTLLNDAGILYLSFVEGDPAQSSFQAGSSGDRVYFYYHERENIKLQLTDHDYKLLKVFDIAYDKGEQAVEMHTVVIAQKM